MKKIFFVVFIAILNFSLFALSFDAEIAVMFPMTQIVYPQSEGFENVVDANTDDDILAFSKELESEFTLQWCEKNLEENSKAALANVLSPLLSKLLPCNDAIFSKAIMLDDGSKSFRFKSLETGNVYFVIIKDGKIISLSWM